MKLNFLFSVAAATFVNGAIKGSSVVYLGKNMGESAHKASGLLYGIPANGSQIPEHYYTDMKFNALRAGGSRLPKPSRGWWAGEDEFQGRYKSMLSDYKTLRKYSSGQFQVLMADLYGSDFTQPASAKSPGDNGDWHDVDTFVSTLVSQLKRDNALDNIYFDIWNEPDGTKFQGRGLDQYIQYWGRAYHQLRYELPDAKIVGPSFAANPSTTNQVSQEWFNKWLSFIKANESIPDTFTFHWIPKSLDLTIKDFNRLLGDAGIDENPTIIINEYGYQNDQFPSTDAWHIAQLERNNVQGLRANWLVKYEIHDYLANLLGKPHTGANHIPDEAIYWPTSQYLVYKYYGSNMTGTRIQTQPTDDYKADTYAVQDNDTVRILAGTTVGDSGWSIQLVGLDHLGLSRAGTLDVHAFRFPATANFEEVDAPEDLGWTSYKYSNATLKISVAQEDPKDTYAFEFRY